jgi:hypothetical protein
MRRRKGETTMGYFRPFFEENPSLLEGKSNEDLIDYWKRDHPGYSDRELKRARQNLANLKSTLRRKERDKRFAHRSAVPPSGAPAFDTPESEFAGLETLEGKIDDCLMMAKSLDRTGLEDVIRHLRLARNEVVLKLP